MRKCTLEKVSWVPRRLQVRVEGYVAADGPRKGSRNPDLLLGHDNFGGVRQAYLGTSSSFLRHDFILKTLHVEQVEPECRLGLCHLRIFLGSVVSGEYV